MSSEGFMSRYIKGELVFFEKAARKLDGLKEN